MAAKTATAAFDVAARTSDRSHGAGCSPSPQLGWGGSRRTKAYGHRRQPARVLPSTSNFPLMMAGPLGGSGRRPCWSRGRRKGTGGTPESGRDRPESRGPCAADGRTAAQCPSVVCLFPAGGCRAGYRRAQDLIGPDSAALGGLSASQMADQLVEVPAIISYSTLHGLVEQNVGIPVPHSRGGRAGHGGLQGVSQGQG